MSEAFLVFIFSFKTAIFLLITFTTQVFYTLFRIQKEFSSGFNLTEKIVDKSLGDHWSNLNFTWLVKKELSWLRCRTNKWQDEKWKEVWCEDPTVVTWNWITIVHLKCRSLKQNLNSTTAFITLLLGGLHGWCWTVGFCVCELSTLF